MTRNRVFMAVFGSATAVKLMAVAVAAASYGTGFAH